MSDVPLREHIEALLSHIDRHFAAKLEATSAAIEKAEEKLDQRLASMNEFRDALKDQAGRLATKQELDLKLERIDARIANIEKSRAYALGAVAVLSTVIASAITLFLK